MENIKPPSVKAATVISRLDPNPPKALPTSMPARARKKVPKAIRYITTSRSPSELKENIVVKSGMLAPIITVVEKII
jgi:hypothetical protein